MKNCNFRRLTDKPKDEEIFPQEETELVDLVQISSGNKSLLPIFKTDSENNQKSESQNSGILIFNKQFFFVFKFIFYLI